MIRHVFIVTDNNTMNVEIKQIANNALKIIIIEISMRNMSHWHRWRRLWGDKLCSWHGVRPYTMVMVKTKLIILQLQNVSFILQRWSLFLCQLACHHDGRIKELFVVHLLLAMVDLSHTRPQQIFRKHQGAHVL